MAEATLELKIMAHATSAIKALEQLATAMTHVRDSASGGLNLSGPTSEIQHLVQAVNEASSAQVISFLNKLSGALSKFQGMGNIQMPNLQPFINNPGNVVPDQTQGAVEQFAEGVRETATEAQETTKSVQGLSKSIKGLVAEAKPATGALLGMFKSIGRIAFNRIIRGAIMAISKAFKEGLENVKAYHKAIGSDLNDAMTQAANATFKMKNSLGASLAPMIRSLLPMLQMLVSWVITAANVMNQFFALLNGAATWTRATDAAASSLDKVKASASGAGGAVKNLLADWDELNIIQSQSGGGGGGGGGYLPVDYESMFEEVEVFDKRIRDVVDFIRDNFDTIKSAAERIGAAILLWNVSQAFGGVIAWLGSIAAEGLVLTVVFDFVRKFDNKFLETGEDGYLIADWITTGFGALLGGKILKSLVKKENVGNAVTAAQVITLTISAFASIYTYLTKVDNSALSEENLKLALTGAGKIGIATGLAAFRWLKPLSGKTTFGARFGNALGLATAATLMTFGVQVGIKAYARAIETDLDEETLVDLATASLAFGAGIGVLGNRIWGINWYRSVEASAGMGLLIFGAGVGIQAVAEAVRNNDITPDTLEKLAMSSVSMSVGAALVGNSLFKLDGSRSLAMGGAALFATVSVATGVMAVAQAVEADGWGVEQYGWLAISSLSMATSAITFTKGTLGLGGSQVWTAALAAGLFTVTTAVGVQAVAQAVKAEKFDDATLQKMAVTSLMMGLTAFTLTKGTLKMSGVKSVAAAVAATGFTIGVETGIKAVVEAKSAGLTKQTFWDIILSSLELALGAGSIAIMAGGSFKIIAAAVIGTALVATVTIGLIAQLSAKKDDSFSWGDENLTEKQVQAFVSTKLFDVDVDTTVNVIASNVQMTESQRDKLQEQLAETLGVIKVIRLGVSTEDTYSELYKQFFGEDGEMGEGTVMGSIKSLIAQAEKTANLTLAFTPVLAGATEEDQANWFTENSEAWAWLGGKFEEKGAELAKLLNKGMHDQLTASEEQLAIDLYNQISNAASIMANAQISGKAFAGFKLSMSNMSEASFEDVMKLYQEYRDNLAAGFSEQIAEQYATALALYETSYAFDPNSETTKWAEAEMTRLGTMMGTAMNEAMEAALAPGRQVFMDWVNDTTKIGVDEWDKMVDQFKKGIPLPGTAGAEYNKLANSEKLEFMGSNETGRLQYLRRIASLVTGISAENFELMNMTGWEFFTPELQSQLISEFMFSNQDQLWKNMIKSYSLGGGFTLQDFGGTTLPDVFGETADYGTAMDNAVAALNGGKTEIITGFGEMGDAAEESAKRVRRAWSFINKESKLDVTDLAGRLAKNGGRGGTNYLATGRVWTGQPSGYPVRATGGETPEGNEKIVSGISIISANQNTENALLREQNDYLRMLLSKEWNVNVTPTTNWAKFGKEAYRRHGVVTGTKGG